MAESRDQGGGRHRLGYPRAGAVALPSFGPSRDREHELMRLAARKKTAMRSPCAGAIGGTKGMKSDREASDRALAAGASGRTRRDTAAFSSNPLKIFGSSI